MRAALLLAPLGLAGCLGFIPASIPLVHVLEEITLSGKGELAANFGPHCDRSDLGKFPDRVKLHWYRERERPEFLLIRDFRETLRAGTWGTMSSGVNTSLSTDPTGAITLPSPFDPPVVVASVRWDGDTVEVDGEPLTPGEPRVLIYDQELPSMRPDLQVSERMTFTLHPDTPVTWERNPGAYCL